MALPRPSSSSVMGPSSPPFPGLSRPAKPPAAETSFLGKKFYQSSPPLPLFLFPATIVLLRSFALRWEGPFPLVTFLFSPCLCGVKEFLWSMGFFPVRFLLGKEWPAINNDSRAGPAAGLFFPLPSVARIFHLQNEHEHPPLFLSPRGLLKASAFKQLLGASPLIGGAGCFPRFY